MNSEEAPARPVAERSDRSSQRAKIITFAGLLVAMLFSALDQTVVSTAMPHIAAELGGLSMYSWVFTAFMLTSSATLPIFGKLSDMFGRKWFVLGGIVLFMGSSMLCGLSTSMIQLAAFRGLQGIGAGSLMSNSMAIIGDLFPPAEQGKYRALNQGVWTLASLAGPLMGGFITDHASWRWVFYINVPVGLISLLILLTYMPADMQKRQRKIDYTGMALLLLFVTPVLLAFSWAGETYPWASLPIIGLFIFAALMCGLFAWVETRAAEPVLPFSLFKNKIFAVSVLAMFLLGFGMFGSMMYLPLFIQGVLGKTATQSGIVMMPMVFASFIAGLVGGQILARRGHYKYLTLFSTGTGALGMFLLSFIGVAPSHLVLALDIMLLGLGFGVSWPVFIVVVQNAFPYERLGQVVSASAFMRSFGGTVGAAVLGSVVARTFASSLQRGLPAEVANSAPAGVIDFQVMLNEDAMLALRTKLAGLGDGVVGQVIEAMRLALSNAVMRGFLIGALVMVLAFITCLFLKEIPLRKTR